MPDDSTEESTDQGSFACGCLVFAEFLAGCVGLGVLFPATRNEESLFYPFAEVASIVWTSLTGEDLPTIGIGTYLLKALGVAAFVVVSCLPGVGIAAALRAMFPDIDFDLQRWGAIASIMGLVIGVAALVLQALTALA